METNEKHEKPSKHAPGHHKKRAQKNSRLVIALLLMGVLVLGAWLYTRSVSNSTYESPEAGVEITEELDCNEIGNEEDDVPEACATEVNEGLKEYCKDEDATAPECADQATLGESTSKHPLAWPIALNNWPKERKKPIMNCDLLYSKDDNKTVSNGIEIGAANGTPVLAAAAGQVTYLDGDNMLIKTSLKNSSGEILYTSYNYFKSGTIKVKKGTKVKKGDVLGQVGSGGDRAELNNSLHFGLQTTGSFLPNDHVKLSTAAGKKRVGQLEHPMNYLPLKDRKVSNCKNFKPFKVPKSNGGSSSSSNSGPAQPTRDYTKVYYRGYKFDRYTVVLLKRAEGHVRAAGLPVPRYVQGSYNTSVSASAKTHAGGGAADVSIRYYSYSNQLRILKAYRKAGFAAWIRVPSEGFTTHMHIVAIGNGAAHSQAKSQVRSYFNGRSGLASNRVDRYAKSVGYPYPDWAKRYK